ncbi:hypothetical protein [Ideonella sp. BN130291]|uniref:hypothetical protein n=1 Tax=Ideonella sp. BN130291 TaxID=3112940 RepID=UPI002E25C035|nr:hypothetical protein [Ideonella sp. BN130291]
MKRRQSVTALAAAFSLVALNACDAKSDRHATPDYEPPSDWRSECAGRLQIKVPPPLYFGEALPEFVPHGNGTYRVAGKKGFGSGTVSVASLKLLEASAIRKADDFGYVDRRAEAHFETFIGGSMSQQETDRRAAITTRQPWREPHSFIWRSGKTFDFGIYVPTDKRPRMLHGEMSGEGSATQAKAVIDAVWPRYRVRTPGEMPSDPGICTPYGFFADPKGVTERDYAFDMPLRDARHSNLLLQLAIKTRNAQPTGEEAQRIDDVPTPWDREDTRSKEEREKCHPQQGTASRNVFGCMFAGTKAIKRHRDVEYLTLAGGQRARLLAVEYIPSLHGVAQYEVILETLGVPGSATQPAIEVNAMGIPKETTIDGMRGKEPPEIDEAVRLVRTIAMSLRLRPGAVDPNAKIHDTLQGVR